MEAKALRPLRWQLLVVGPGCLEQVEGAEHVAADKHARTINRSINMALGSQVHHQIGIGLPHRSGGGFSVAEVHLQQLVALRGSLTELLNAREVTGVAALIEIEDLDVGLRQQAPDHSPTNESGPTGHQHALDRAGKRNRHQAEAQAGLEAMRSSTWDKAARQCCGSRPKTWRVALHSSKE